MNLNAATLAVIVMAIIVIAVFTASATCTANAALTQVFIAGASRRGAAASYAAARPEKAAGGAENLATAPSGGRGADPKRVDRGAGAPSSRTNWARFGGELSDGVGDGGRPGGESPGEDARIDKSVVEGLRGEFGGMSTLRAGSYGPDA